MISGTVINNNPLRTYFGLKYLIKFDTNPEAKPASGEAGTAIAGNTHGLEKLYKSGDRVILEYYSTKNYGLWFIVGRSNE